MENQRWSDEVTDRRARLRVRQHWLGILLAPLMTVTLDEQRNLTEPHILFCKSEPDTLFSAGLLCRLDETTYAKVRGTSLARSRCSPNVNFLPFHITFLEFLNVFMLGSTVGKGVFNYTSQRVRNIWGEDIDPKLPTLFLWKENSERLQIRTALLAAGAPRMSLTP